MNKRALSLLLAAVMILSMTSSALAEPPSSTCHSGKGNGDHLWIGDPVSASCEKPAMTCYYCAYCGEYYEEVTGPALGHDWGEWQTRTAADCTTPGVEYRICRRCGISDIRQAAAQHAYGPWTVDEKGSCLTQELQKRTCEKCGHVDWKYAGYGDHAWSAWETIMEPVGQSAGIERRVCAVSNQHVEQRWTESSGTGAAITAEGLDVSLTVSTGLANHLKRAGDMVYAYLTVANTGSKPWMLDGLTWTHLYNISSPAYDDSQWLSCRGKTLQPGEYLSFNLGIKVAQEDLDNEAVERDVYVQVKSLDGSESASSDIETIFAYLTEGGYSIYLSGSAESRAYAVGESLDIHLAVTNTGMVPLSYQGHTAVIPAGESDPLAGLPAALAPGETWYAPVYTTAVHPEEVEHPTGNDPGWFGRYFDVTYGNDTPLGLESAWDEALFQFPILLEGGQQLPADDPENGTPNLIVSASCWTGEPFYFDYQGRTEPVIYLITAYNAGDSACTLSRIEMTAADGVHTVNAGGYRLKPGEYFSLTVHHCFAETEKNAQGKVQIGFAAIGSYAGGTVRSDQVFLSHLTSSELPPWTPPSDSGMRTVIKVTSTPENGEIYVDRETVSFEFLLTNSGEEPLSEVTVWNSLYDEKVKMTVLHDLEPGQMQIVPFTYSVEGKDVENGYLSCVLHMAWQDPISETELTAWSYPVIVPVSQENPTCVEFGVDFQNPPANGSFYELGEKVPVRIHWENRSKEWLYRVMVTDDMAHWSSHTEDGEVVLTADTLAPGESGFFDYEYTVNAYDISRGYTCDMACFEAWDAADKLVFRSDPCLHNAGRNGVSVLSVTQEETSAPANGRSYTAGEKIVYEIHLQNIGWEALKDVRLFDTLSAKGPDGCIARWDALIPGEEQVYTFTYTVTEADAAAGKVVNQAVGAHLVLEGYIPIESTVVESPAG